MRVAQGQLGHIARAQLGCEGAHCLNIQLKPAAAGSSEMGFYLAGMFKEEPTASTSSSSLQKGHKMQFIGVFIGVL